MSIGTRLAQAEVDEKSQAQYRYNALLHTGKLADAPLDEIQSLCRLLGLKHNDVDADVAALIALRRTESELPDDSAITEAAEQFKAAQDAEKAALEAWEQSRSAVRNHAVHRLYLKRAKTQEKIDDLKFRNPRIVG